MSDEVTPRQAVAATRWLRTLYDEARGDALHRTNEDDHSRHCLGVVLAAGEHLVHVQRNGQARRGLTAPVAAAALLGTLAGCDLPLKELLDGLEGEIDHDVQRRATHALLEWMERAEEWRSS